jgi:hypothetical protein
MKTLDIVREMLAATENLTQAESKEMIHSAQEHIQKTIKSTTQHALLAGLPGHDPETSVYMQRIQDASTFVGGSGISVTDIKEAHQLNKTISHMYKPQTARPTTFQPSPYLRRHANTNTTYQPGGLDGMYPAGAAGGMYPAGAAGVTYPAGAAGGMYPAGAAGGMYPAGAAASMDPVGTMGGKNTTGAMAGRGPPYIPAMRPVARVDIDQCRHCGQRGHYAAQCPLRGTAGFQPTPRY